MAGPVRVIIPWRDDGQPARRSSLDWCLGRWRDHGIEPVVAGLHRADPWSKGSALNDAVGLDTSHDPVLVIADADVFLTATGVHRLTLAEDFVGRHTSGWAVPTSHVVRLTDLASAALKVNPSPPVGWCPTAADVEERHRQHPGGGLVVISREAYTACPVDPRFVGWGHEDDAWSYALHTMIGPPLRGAGTLYHLWHEPQPRPSRMRGSDASRALFERYHDARGQPERVEAIINEWRSDQ